MQCMTSSYRRRKAPLGGTDDSPASNTTTANAAAESRPVHPSTGTSVLYGALPLLSQLLILMYAVHQGHWIMAVTGLPVICGYLAQLIPSAHSTGGAKHSASDSETTVVGVSDSPGAESDQSTQNEARVTDIPLGSFYEELGLSPFTTDSQLWRRLVGLWMGSCDVGAAGLSATPVPIETDHAVPLGMTSCGSLDISLPKHGPHAMVAGTTGSGKSVLLHHWCLALAARHSPRALNLVLLDFKGGATFRTLSHLPHTVGCVSDLDLSHALRALNGIEAELRRRELLLHRLQVSSYEELKNPPARVVIVVDEFHALHQQLPDAEERLGRIASLGRSLGMHIILSTQHPLGQISSQIKANIALRICLRMQDAMQSIDVLGDAIATELPGTAAGYAYCRDANGLHVFRGLTVRQPERLILAMNTACRFLRHNRPQELFTPPLPHLLHADMLLDVDSSTTDGSTQAKVPTARIGLQDDGMRTRLCTLRFDGLNVAVIGPPGSGKSSLLAVIAAELRKQEGVDVTIIEDYDAIAGTIRAIPTHTNDAIVSDGVPKPQSPTCLQRPDEVIIGEFHASTQHSTSRRRFTVILIDTASDVSHRFDHPLASAGVQRVLQSDDVSVVFTCESMSQLPRSESFPWRIVFPTGEHDRDVMSGIPRCLLSVMRKDEFGLPGRGFIMRNGNAVALQCVGFARPGERPSSAVALELE